MENEPTTPAQEEQKPTDETRPLTPPPSPIMEGNMERVVREQAERGGLGKFIFDMFNMD